MCLLGFFESMDQLQRMGIHAVRERIMSNDVSKEIRERAAAKTAYVKSLLGFIAGLVVLALINLLTSPDYWWVLWVAGFGGLGFVVKGIKVFGNCGQMEKNLQEHFEKKEQEKRHT